MKADGVALRGSRTNWDRESVSGPLAIPGSSKCPCRWSRTSSSSEVSFRYLGQGRASYFPP